MLVAFAHAQVTLKILTVSSSFTPKHKEFCEMIDNILEKLTPKLSALEVSTELDSYHGTSEKDMS
jgi:hypothetical protein